MKTTQNSKIDLSSILLNASFLLFSTLIITIITIIGTSPAHAESTSSSANASVTVSDSIRLTLTGGDLVINNLTPGTSADSNIITATVTSNSPYGFHLSATTGTKNGTTSLVNTADSNFSFTNLNANKATLNDFSDNTWGYSYSTNDGTSWVSGDYGTTQTGYNGLSLDNDDSGATGTTLFNSDTYTNSTAIKFKIGAKSSSTQASGTYTGTVNFYAVTNPKPIPEMQNLSASECTSTMSQAIDNRDGTLYNIQRLADGKCWLLDNLALDLTNSTVLNGMNESNTNASNTTLGYLKGTTTRDPSTYVNGQYATAGVSNWTSDHSYSDPLVNITNKDVVPTTSYGTDDPMKNAVVAGNWKVGGYYNYCAASAGSYCYGNGTSEGTSSGNATEDICPKGWRMPGGSDTVNLTATPPTGEYQNLYGNSSYNTYANYRSALRLPLSGYFINGSAYNQGSSGYWWSSTRSSNDYMYSLYAGTSSISPDRGNYRDRGYSVRCVLGS